MLNKEITEKYRYHYNYIITNLNNHKRYIGVRSCNCRPVEDIGYWGSCNLLKEIMLKEGEGCFKKDIFKIWGTRELAVEHEIMLHDYFEVAINPMFYNEAKQTSIRFDTTGKKHIKETRKKMSESHVDIRGENNPMYGRKHTEETKKKISKVHKGKFISDETKKKISEKLIGKRHTEETKKKISEKLIGKRHTEEHKKNLSKSVIGKKHTEETKKKMSISTSGVNNPMYGKKCTEEAKKKMRETQKGNRWMNKDKVVKMVHFNNIEEYVNNGWLFGRK